MKIKEAKTIVQSIELTEPALQRAMELLASWGDDESELADENIDQIIAIIDSDIEVDRNIANASEEMTAAMSAFLAESKKRGKMAADEVEATTKDMYEEASKDDDATE